MDVRLKRAYERASAEDGYRVLVDRLWPRGVSREQAKLDAWEKELAPSEHNDAVVLAEVLRRGLPKSETSRTPPPTTPTAARSGQPSRRRST